MDSRELRSLLLVLAACGGAPSKAPPLQRGGETAACRTERLAILEASTHTRDCTTVADCTTITNPGHPSDEVYLVVHVADGPALKTRAETHLARCGAFMHREPIGAYVVVEPACTASRCIAVETTFHTE